ncbi:alpha/beta fold hydrolase [Streptomyces violascens]|uniref:alpha/beta fold hydrolase n=1 Tax=Streptomyces violascens TaxID=67381 RepID=UPI003679664E
MSRAFTITAADTHLDGVDTLGDGPPLLFLNDDFSTQRHWGRVLRRLDGKYRTVTFDARGRGRSGTSSDYSLRGAIDDVDRVIEATALTRPVLVGSSHGATLALCYAAEYPELVGGLVLVDGAYPVSVLDEHGKKRVHERFRGRGWARRVPARPGRAVRLSPRECAEAVIATDEVNGQLIADYSELRCPTTLVAGHGTFPAGLEQEEGARRLATARAVASSDRTTLLVTTYGGYGRILDKDPGIVVTAIEDVIGRSAPAAAVSTGTRWRGAA